MDSDSAYEPTDIDTQTDTNPKYEQAKLERESIHAGNQIDFIHEDELKQMPKMS